MRQHLAAAAVFVLWAMAAAAPAQATRSAAPPPATGQSFDEGAELMLFQDIPIVVAAGKRQQTQKQAAASVSVVTADDIELFGYRSLADVLRNQRSFYLHTDGLNWFAGVRGFLRPGEWNARLLVLVDGRPTREPIYGETHLDQDFVVPMDTIKRVEIVRGPGSALYGSNAVFAVVNVVTKDGADINGTQVKLQGGTRNTAGGSALFGRKFDNGWDVVASVSGFMNGGKNDIHYDEVHDPAHNFGHIKDHDYEAAVDAFVKARKGEFTAQLDYARRDRDNRSATYNVSWFDPGSMQEERANLSLRWDHEINKDQSLHAMAYYGRYIYQQHWRYDDPAGDYRYESDADSQWLGAEVHYDWQMSRSLHLTLGAEGTQSLRARQNDFDGTSHGLLDIDPSFSSCGVFAEGELKATDWLTLIAGLRMDHVERIGTRFNPRAAAIVTPTKDDTLKALYGRAFRAPNLYEMLYASPGANTPNPALNPEVCDTWELVWERQYSHGWRTTVDAYYWKMSDALGDFEMSDGSLQTRNTGAISARGIELEVQKQWDTGARLRAYGTLGQAARHGERLTHSPQWIVGVSAAVPFINRKTFLAIEPQIVGPMKNDLGDWSSATFITNVVLTSREITKGLDVQVGVYNLFARCARLPRNSPFDHYQPWLNWPDTQAMVSLSYRF